MRRPVPRPANRSTSRSSARSTRPSTFSIPNGATGAEAFFDAYNARGGLDGRPIVYSTCNDANDPNEATKCGREAVDEGAVAALTGFSASAPTVLPIFEAAGGLTWIIGSPQYPIEYTDTQSFPLGGGSQVEMAASVMSGAEYGDCTAFAAIRYEGPGVDTLVDIVKVTTEVIGVEYVGDVVAALQAPDLAPAVASATDNGADCLVAIMPAQDAAKIVTAATQAGNVKHVVGTVAALPPTVMSQLGSAADIVITSSSYLPVNTADNDGVTEFLADWKAKTSDEPDIVALRSRLAARFLTEVLATIDGEITPASVLAAATDARDVDMLGITAPFSAEPTKLAGLERLFNANSYPIEVVGGEYVLLGATLDAAPVMEAKYSS